MKKILVVGQTPPPYGGQAIMIQYMLEGDYSDIELFHVRMCFSRQFNDLGHAQINKITHLLDVIKNIWIARFKYGTHILYYPLSGATNSSLVRDFVILACTRFLFNKTIYHFHGAGISNHLPKLNFMVRLLCYSVFKKPNLSITSSEFNPKDGDYLKSKSVEIIPLGIPDMNKGEERKSFCQGTRLKILFMGLLNTTKGEGYVLDAIREVCKAGKEVEFHLAGCFESIEYQESFFKKVGEYGLKDRVCYHGVVTGDEKKKLFLSCDVFCFPSFFAFESFGIVLLEAMMYQMPLIASRWRGIQSIIEDGKNGFLVDIRNSEQIADSILLLINDRILFEKMAKNSREMFKEKYGVSTYLENMEKVMSNV